MFEWFKEEAGNVAEGLPTELVGGVLSTLIALALAAFVYHVWEKKKFGGWRVLGIDRSGDTKINRPLSVQTAKILFSDEYNKGVILKGIASPLGWLNADLISEGPSLGLLVVNHVDRTIMIDIRKNPPSAPRGPQTSLMDQQQFEKIVAGLKSLGASWPEES